MAKRGTQSLPKRTGAKESQLEKRRASFPLVGDRPESSEGIVDTVPSIESLEQRSDLPLLAFEPQLVRLNRVLHHWLDQCHHATFENAGDKFSAIAKMSKALHENLKMVLEVLRLLHEVHDTRTFNRLVLEAIQAVSPEIRLQIVTKLQQIRGEMRELKGGIGSPFEGDI